MFLNFRYSLIIVLLGFLIGYTITFTLTFIIFYNFSPRGSHPKPDLLCSIQRNSTVSQSLSRQVRVFCAILTAPKNHETRAKAVKDTWGSLCTKILFFSSKKSKDLPVVVIEMDSNERKFLWNKTKEAFKYVYKNHQKDADWFLKADDDTYFVMDNLRYLLSLRKKEEPVYFGCKFKRYVKQGYMSGGAGYILSKESLRRFALGASRNNTACSAVKGNEDTKMGKCMQSVRVKAEGFLDSAGRVLFLPISFEHLLIPGRVPPDFWLFKYLPKKVTMGFQCCSDIAISFHYIRPDMMYFIQYLLYHVHPLGIYRNGAQLPSFRNTTFRSV